MYLNCVNREDDEFPTPAIYLATASIWIANSLPVTDMHSASPPEIETLALSQCVHQKTIHCYFVAQATLAVNSETSQLWMLQTSKLLNPECYKLPNFPTSQIRPFTSSELHNFTTSKLHNFTTSQLSNFQTSQLHNLECGDLRKIESRMFASCMIYAYVAEEINWKWNVGRGKQCEQKPTDVCSMRLVVLKHGKLWDQQQTMFRINARHSIDLLSG